jgi:DAACS family dicarboxylate/amino acid:cation (Na+ or H+) symporter
MAENSANTRPPPGGGITSIQYIFWANITALVFGCVLGRFWGALPAGSETLFSIFAWLPVALVKSFAAPLLFLAILNGMMADQPLMTGLRRLVVICLINALLAISIALILVNSLKPGLFMQDLVRGFSTAQLAPEGTVHIPKVAGWADVTKSFIPDSIVKPFLDNNIPAIIVLAIFVGLGIRGAGRRDGVWGSKFVTFRSYVELALSVVAVILRNILILMPIAIFAAVAKATGELGMEVFRSLFLYLFITILGMFFQVVFVYHSWIIRRSRRTLRQFWHHAKVPVIYAFGVNSSLSSLPATLDALDNLNCSKASARLGACIGTNLNNDGILLYEVVAVIMLAQAFGMDWSYFQQLGIAGVCVLATLGVSGFPEAGVVALSLVLPVAGLPIEMMPLLLPADWIVARCRSATNVISDMTVSLAIDGPPKNVEAEVS